MSFRAPRDPEPTFYASNVDPRVAFAPHASARRYALGLPRGAFIQVRLDEPLQREFTAPTLIRWDCLSVDPGAGTVIHGAVRVTGELVSPSDEQYRAFSVGNYLFIPEPGVYRITALCSSNTYPQAYLRGTSFEGISHELATAYLTSDIPAFQEPTRVVRLDPSPLRLAPSDLTLIGTQDVPPAQRLHSLTVSLVDFPSAPTRRAYVLLGTNDTGEVGHPLTEANPTIQFPPGTITLADAWGWADENLAVVVTATYR